MEREIKMEGSAGEKVPKTVDEFDQFLELVKQQHPDKYEMGVATGEWEKLKSKLPGYKPKTEKGDKKKV